MRNRTLWISVIFWAVSSLSLLSSCSKDEVAQEVPSATDPYPYPKDYTDNKDLSVNPGDSFFDYCNGTWLKKNPIPADPTKNLGGLYAAEAVMNERIEQLKRDVPDMGKFFALMDHIHDYPTESRAYIEAEMAKMKKPSSKEEAYRAIGKLYLEGINVLDAGVFLIWDKDKLKLILSPIDFPENDETTILRLQSQERHSLSQTRAGGNTSIPALLAEGMGVDAALLEVTDEEMEVWTKYWNKYSTDDLYLAMQRGWLEYLAFADEEGLKQYNEAKGLKLTMKDLRTKSRLGLGYAISYYMQQKFFPQSLKDKFLGITKEIQAALKKRIERVEWMSETTKQNAIDKLNHYSLNVAFPDTWHQDCIPTLSDCKTMVEALHRLRKGTALLRTKLLGGRDLFSYRLLMELLNSNGEMVPMDLTLVNATYSASDNSVTIFPAMLLPPMMPEGDVSEACYYAVFSIIGHEFTHGFDNNGAQWDKYGVRKNWWAVADKMNFEDRKANLIRTYDNMELDPERASLFYCDGKRTQGENIADLGGFLTALDAYQARLDQQGFTGETRKEQLRKFYESYAHLWCIQYGEKKFQILKNSDVHAHARLRVNGVVMNTDLWYDLYNVNKNNLLYLPVERRAYIW